MRLIFMGTPQFAVPTLKKLYELNYSIVAVYTQPPRPKNRGHQITKSPVHDLANLLNIPVFTPPNFKDVQGINIFKSHNADAVIVAAYGIILKKEILDATRYGCFNVHGSLLPRWRGAAPIHRAMLEGDIKTGITIMKMDEGLDTGDMILKEEYQLNSKLTFSKVHDDLSVLGANLMAMALEQLKNKSICFERQDQSFATYAKKIEKEEGHLDFSKSAEFNLRKIKTLNPHPGTFCFFEDVILKIHDCDENIISDCSGKERTHLGNGFIQCQDGIIRITKIQKPSGKILFIDDFLRGFSLPNGLYFT